MNFSAKLRLYFHICKRFRGKVTEKVGKLRTLSRKDLRYLRIENRRPKGKQNLHDLFFVPQISQIHTDSWLGFKVTQMTQIPQMIGDVIPKTSQK